jgi:uncharacterized cupredoxin-like copper-binding protein
MRILLTATLFAITAGVLFPSAAFTRELDVRIAGTWPRLEMEFNFPEVSMSEDELEGEAFHRISMEGAKKLADPGRPELPFVTRLIAIGPTGGVKARMVDSEFHILDDVNVSPAGPNLIEGSTEDISAFEKRPDPYSGFYPAEIVTVSEPAIMRDLRLVSVTVSPVRFDPESGKLKVYERMVIELEEDSSTNVNAKHYGAGSHSSAFTGLYETLVSNYSRPGVSSTQTGTYLIITHDRFFDEVQLMADWKKRKGWPVVVTPLSEIGTSPTAGEIKQYIQDAYDTWQLPPEYLLLVGDTQMSGIGDFPSFYYDAGLVSDVTDLPYALLEGEDYFPDLFVGRLSVDSDGEALVACIKTVKYESEPNKAANGWADRALVVGANYGAVPPPITPVWTSRWVRDKLIDYGYSQVDTAFYPPTTSGEGITTALNNGVGIINYRGWAGATGWYYPGFYGSDVQALSNHWMLPVITSVVCGTGDFDNISDPCFGEKWIRSGTPSYPNGAVAFVGSSEPFTHTKWNNTLNGGFYTGLCDEGLRTLGETLLRAKYEVYLNYPNDNYYPGSEVEFYYHVYGILGDPELNVWTRTPVTMVAEYDSTLAEGVNWLPIEVTDGLSAPVADAWVCLSDTGSFQAVTRTDASGNAVLNFPPLDAGTYFFTVTKPDYAPFLSRVIVSTTEQQLTASSFTIDDDFNGTSMGNSDGLANPGETIELGTWLRNLGTSSCDSAFATISTQDICLAILDSTDYFGMISPGDSSLGSGGFVIRLAEDCPDKHQIHITATAGDESKSEWVSELVLDVFAPHYVYKDHSIVDMKGDSTLDPGEEAMLTVTVSNAGRSVADSVTGTLTSSARQIEITDGNSFFGQISSGGEAANSSSAFWIKAHPTCHRGFTANLELTLTGSSGFEEIIHVPVTVGKVTASAPMGPDNYGYYAFDDTDTDYTEAPVYDWTEIDPSFGGAGTALVLGDDETTTLPLPFSFTYYGTTYDVISVCSNGWIAMGDEYYIDFKNTAIPAALGPYAMIAPLWDDHDPEHESSSGIFYSYDSVNHRFIVEWSRLESSEDTNLLSFQVILFDPAYHETITGDGEIQFNYYKVANIDTSGDYLTVGIESPDQSDGLEYTYANIYHPGAAVLRDGRAVKFTTDSPKLSKFRINPLNDAGSLSSSVRIRSSYPNPFAPSTTIELEVEESVSARLNVYDINGRLIRTIHDGDFQPGIMTFGWDGNDENGFEVASGVYFLRVESDAGAAMSKIVKLR